MSEQKEWKYCVVGNIVESRVDEEGNLWYGTAAFVGGTKVYLCGKYWDSTQDTIRVIGLNRRKRFQVIDTPCELIENLRCQRTYKPSVLNLMNNWEFYDCWWGNGEEDKREAEEFVQRWCRRR